MYCSKCGNMINFGEKFCGKCGNPIVSNLNNDGVNPTNQLLNSLNTQNNDNQYQHNEIYNDQQRKDYQVSGINQNNNIDEELLKAFVGKNYDKIRHKSFNFSMFFFGITYTLYRKMWLLSLIIWALSTVISIFLSKISFVLIIGINIFLAIKWKDIYLKHCREKVAEIRKDNPNLSYQNLIGLCTKKGGTTIIPVVIITILSLIILIIFCVMGYRVTKNIISNSQLSLYERNSQVFVNQLESNCLVLEMHGNIDDPTTVLSAETILNYTKDNSSVKFPDNKLYGKTNMFDEFCNVSEYSLGSLYYDDVVCSYSYDGWTCVSK